MHRSALMTLTSLVLVLFCGGCATENRTDFRRGTIYGLVINEEGQPIAGARISAGTRSAVADSQGRFRISDLSPGPVSLAVRAARHEHASARVEILNRAIYLQLQLLSLPGLVDRTLAALEHGDVERARRLFARLRALDPADRRVRALAGILGGES